MSNFPVPETAFRANHDPVCVRIFKTVTMTADPCGLPPRHADDHRIIRNIPGHDRSRRDESVAADADSANNRGIGADTRSTPNQNSFIQRMAFHLTAGIGYISQHATGSEKHIIFHNGPGVDCHIVLNLDIVADCNVIGNIDILAENAPAPDSRATLNMAEMPDFCSAADSDVLIDIGGFMHKKITHKFNFSFRIFTIF